MSDHMNMAELMAVVTAVPGSATAGAIAAQRAAEAAQAAAEQVLEDIPADYSELSQDVAELKSAIGDLDDLETADKSNLVAAINEAAQTGGGGGITKTDTGTELDINAVAGAPESLSVAFEWSQGDVTNISPQNPVPIATTEDCTITVNGVDFEQDFTSDIGAAGIGKGTWDAMSGSAVVTQKAVIVTADMVTSLARVSGDIYAAVLNLGTPVYAAGGGILACSHYPIGTTSGIYLRNGTLYLYGSFANDLASVKSYVAGLNMVVIFAIETPEQYSLTPKQIALTDGANTISTDTGTMTVTYSVDLQDYIDTAIGDVADVADTALETAEGASVHADALQTDVDTINENLYKYRTETGSNTGTGAAETSSNIHWGVFVDVDPLIEQCRNLTMTPACSNATAGTYTATRWKNASGNALTAGETLTVVETKTANKGESVTFDNLGIGEFVSVAFTSGSTQRTTYESDLGVAKAHIGYVNPVTGVYTNFSGYLSGEFSIVLCKPISVDSMTLFGKRITLVGDSITEKNGRANVNHGMWLERWTGCIIQNLGVGGTGFARTPGSTNYKTRLSKVNVDADIIGVAASFNDMTYTVGTPTDTVTDGTICGYANEFFDELLALCPTARIACYSEGPWESYRPGVEKSDNFMAAMQTICENKGIVWDDGLYRGCALRPWIQANREVYYKGEGGSYIDVVDNIHPNSAGQKVIARYLERLFEKMVD